MTFSQNNSGIKSLAGFSFQIKVFCNLASTLKKDQQIEFESLDDIAKNKDVTAKTIDIVDSKILSSTYDLIQVKHTKLTEEVAENVLLNWILLENSQYNVSHYILLTDVSYNKIDIIKSINIDKFINKIISSTKRKDSNISKVKEIFKDKTSDEQKAVIEDILQKYMFQSVDINTELIENLSNIFFRSANEVIYYQRLDEFLSEITNKILKSINNSQPYILTYEDFQKIANDIIQKFSVEVSLPSYFDFKTVHPIDLKDLKIANSREYKQLLCCNIQENSMRNYLLHSQYYRKVRSNYIDACMESKCGNIEVTAHENFETTKDELQEENRDTPKNRLKETTKAQNSYADNDQIREGACVYLTSDNVPNNLQISWKDE